MDEYAYGSTRDAAARALGQEAARSFASNPVEGATMESFVLGDVTADVIRLTREFQQTQQSKIKAWRRRHFLAPIGLAVAGLVIAITTTPRQGTDDSSLVPGLGAVGMLAGVIWFIVIAVRASSRFADAQRAREVETGRLLEIARHAAAETYADAGTTPVAKADADTEDHADAPTAPSAPSADAASPTAAARAPLATASHFTGAPAPAGQPFGVTQGGAGQLVAAWMRHLGEADAAAAPHSPGAVVGAMGARHVARVVNDDGTVDAEAVRELAALAAADGRGGLFFTAGSYDAEALEVAEQSRVALFTYDAVAGTLQGANPLGETAMTDGL
ncbi:restriction endonuclease [Demequina sp. TTPB684]|uniref:restriction endonuclease n=1 Tax=unclassified Demequina TaxID=2620311 RepID=UPI001CF4A03F|nr:MULTISPECIES: restriction endonuclease [unclassified Demequina]MCB2412413.1 restriction endonuclease [Demequina sp. TTPB684]UPU89503.1 restriction endonuclease [Demequina sp. TMPB413]